MNWTYNNGVITVPQINGGTADIDLRTTPYLDRVFLCYKYARKAEEASQWSVAAEIWQIAGRAEEAVICRDIAAAIEIGDQIRAKNFEQ